MSYDNSLLKGAFQKINKQIVAKLNTKHVIDYMHCDRVITFDVYVILIRLSGATQVRRLMALLHNSDNPRAFIVLRKALEENHAHLVEDVDRLYRQGGNMTTFCC